MKTQDVIIAHPQTGEEVNALKAFMKALKIKFEVSKKEALPYKSEFVAKIEASKKEFEKGEFVRVKQEDLQDFLGLK